ncbi:hypothetical protein MNBD_NITROSPINAE03-1060, partial [hydrothermal vent metagenome]
GEETLLTQFMNLIDFFNKRRIK